MKRFHRHFNEKNLDVSGSKTTESNATHPKFTSFRHITFHSNHSQTEATNSTDDTTPLDFLRPVLKTSLPFANLVEKIPLSDDDQSKISHLQVDLLNILTDYRDLYSPTVTLDNLSEFRVAYLAHTLNHVLLNQKIIAKNNRSLKKQKLEKKKTGEKCTPVTLLPADDDSEVQSAKDQGFCRPRVLLLTPFRHGALQIVHILANLLFGPDGKQMVTHRKKFESEYGYDNDDDECEWIYPPT